MKIALAMLATTAALLARAADDATVTAELSQLRTARGVCASDFQGAAVAAYVRPEVCIRIGSAKDKSDKNAWLFVDVETDGKHDADVRQWKVAVTGPGGKVLVSRALAKSAVERASCSIDGCNNTYTVLKMPKWKRGTYRFRLVYSEDAEVASSLAITLQ